MLDAVIEVDPVIEVGGMSDIARVGGQIAPFSPQSTRTNQAKADAIIDFAAKVKNWPLVEEAIDAKIEDQREFVEWWETYVKWGGDRSKVTGSVTLTVEVAENRTEITKKQVSRWRKSLRDIPKYRERLIVAAYRKAELVPVENHRAEGTGEN